MRRLIGIAIPVAALASLLACVAPAGATSGEVTRAEASADWTEGSIAGSVTWTGCERPIDMPEGPKPEEPNEEGPDELPGGEQPYCGWIPFVSIGPGSDPSECATAGRMQLDALVPGIVLAWTGAKGIGESGRQEFSVSGVGLDGSPEQLACLVVIEVAPIWICPPHDPCDFTMGQFPAAVASAQLEELPAPDGGAPLAGAAASPASRQIVKRSRNCRKFKHPVAHVRSGAAGCRPIPVHHRRHGHVRKK